jgi:hypothetical protein
MCIVWFRVMEDKLLKKVMTPQSSVVNATMLTKIQKVQRVPYAMQRLTMQWNTHMTTYIIQYTLTRNGSSSLKTY